MGLAGLGQIDCEHTARAQGIQSPDHRRWTGRTMSVERGTLKYSEVKLIICQKLGRKIFETLKSSNGHVIKWIKRSCRS